MRCAATGVDLALLRPHLPCPCAPRAPSAAKGLEKEPFSLAARFDVDLEAADIATLPATKRLQRLKAVRGSTTRPTSAKRLLCRYVWRSVIVPSLTRTGRCLCCRAAGCHCSCYVLEGRVVWRVPSGAPRPEVRCVQAPRACSPPHPSAIN